MPDNVADRLERRYSQLTRQDDDVAFLRQVQPYLEALDAESPVHRILKRLRQDAERAVDEFNATERELVREAVDVRRRLAEAAPDVDNTNEPEPDMRGHAYGRWMLDSFANFDRQAGSQRRLEFAPLPYYDTSDKAPLATMLIILRGRLLAAQYGDRPGLLEERENLRPDLDDFGREIHNIQEKHSAAVTAFRERARSLPGLADERLRAFTAVSEPQPFLIDADEDVDTVAERAFLRGVQQLGIVGVIRDALAGEMRDAGSRAAFAELIAFLRGEAERLHEEVILRLGRGEGEGATRRVLTAVGRGSLKAGIFVASVVVTAIVTLLVSAYAADWLPGQDDDSTPARTAPAAPE